MSARNNRQSSIDSYQNKWSLYIQWCKSRMFHPIYTNLSHVCAFLNYLFELGRSSSTVLGYLACISTLTELVTEEKWGSNLIVKNLISHLSRKYYKPTREPPQWEISVLNGLAKVNNRTCHKYELLQKSAFLLTLAAGARRSEVHAFLYTDLKHDINWTYVTIQIKESFLAKHQKTVKKKGAMKPLTVWALPLIENEHNPICPVWTLRAYVNRTKHSRSPGQVRLFIPSKDKLSKDIKIDSVSRWIKQGIELGYSFMDEVVNTPHYAHQVRSTASSVAFATGVPLSQVLEAGNWSSQHTFFKNYYYPPSKTTTEWLSQNTTTVMGKAVGQAQHHKSRRH